MKGPASRIKRSIFKALSWHCQYSYEHFFLRVKMKKSFLAGALAVVMLAAVLAAGCTFPMTSSPTSTPSTQNVSQYLTTMMQERNFTMMTPFSSQSSLQTGTAVYNGTASDNNGTYAVSVQAWNNAQTAQAQFVALKTMFMGQGYAVVQENATAWLGFN